jgi:hypothetical protein
VYCHIPSLHRRVLVFWPILCKEKLYLVFNTMKIHHSVLHLNFLFNCLFISSSTWCESLDIQKTTTFFVNSRFSFSFMFYDTIGRMLCIKECLRYPACLAVNFDRERLICELVAFSSDANPAYLLKDSQFEHIVMNKTTDTWASHKMVSTYNS